MSLQNSVLHSTDQLYAPGDVLSLRLEVGRLNSERGRSQDIIGIHLSSSVRKRIWIDFVTLEVQLKGKPSMTLLYRSIHRRYASAPSISKINPWREWILLLDKQ
jgi:hypothetical protein